MDSKGGMPSDIKAEEWKVEVGGQSVLLKQVDSPELTGTLVQNWALVFEPILGPHFRAKAFQSTAQFLLNLPKGDRVLLVARTKEGLVPLTHGLTPDSAEWQKALERLPSVLSMTFEGTPGTMSPSLANLAEPAPQATPSSREAFAAFVKTYLEGLTKTSEAGPYGKPEPRGMKIIERLGLDSPTEARGKLKVVPVSPFGETSPPKLRLLGGSPSTSTLSCPPDSVLPSSPSAAATVCSGTSPLLPPPASRASPFELRGKA